jgi:hypothetical protein
VEDLDGLGAIQVEAAQAGLGAWTAPGCLVAAVATVVLALPSLTFPSGADPALFSIWGRMMADGAEPYRDVWHHRTPGYYALACLGHELGLRGMLIPRTRSSPTPAPPA